MPPSSRGPRRPLLVAALLLAGTCPPVALTLARGGAFGAPAAAQVIEAEDIEPAPPAEPAATEATATPPKDFTSLLAEAEQAYAEGRYEEAVAAYADAVRAAPTIEQKTQTLVTLAVLQHAQKQGVAARAALAEAVYLSPALTLPPERYPIQLLDLFYEAQKEGLERRAQEAIFRLKEAREAFDRGADGEARAGLEQALALQPNEPNALLLLALIDLRGGSTEKAEAGFEKLLSLRQAQPGRVSDAVAATALANLGHFYRTREFWEDAEARLRQAVELDPSLGEAWVDLALAQRALGLREAARGSLLKARGLRPGDEVVLYNLGLAYSENGQHAEAVELLADATRRNPQSARLWSLLAAEQRAVADTEGQEASLRRVQALDPVNQAGLAAGAARDLSALLLARGDAAAAANEAERAVALTPKDALAWSHLGAARRSLGELETALAHWTRAAELEPRRGEFQNDLGSVLYQMDRFAEALARFESALELRPDFPEAAANRDLARARVEEIQRLETVLGLKVSRFSDATGRRGLRLEVVAPEGPAARADLLPGDLLVRIDGAPMTSAQDLAAQLVRQPQPKALAAEWLRQNKLMKGKIKLPRP